MKNPLKITLAALALTATAGTLAGFSALETRTESTSTASAAESAAQTYAVDTVHSGVFFKIRHNGVANFYGRLNDVQGTIEFDKDDIESASMNFTVKTESVDTNNQKRDDHIRGADFFNARQYPEATFTSSSVTKSGEGYEVTGELSLHGQTQQVTAKLIDIDTGTARGNDVMGLEAHFEISRTDFGITTYVNPEDPEEGSLGDKVKIIVSIEAGVK
ncbi:MAG: YceI family protein [Phycisphaerales bacterium]